MTNLEAHFGEIIQRFHSFEHNFPAIPLETVMLLAITAVEEENGETISGANEGQRLINMLEILKKPSDKEMPNG